MTNMVREIYSLDSFFPRCLKPNRRLKKYCCDDDASYCEMAHCHYTITISNIYQSLMWHQNHIIVVIFQSRLHCSFPIPSACGSGGGAEPGCWSGAMDRSGTGPPASGGATSPCGIEFIAQ